MENTILTEEFTAEKKQRGFLTVAQNNSKVDYVRLAYALALSLKLSQKSKGAISDLSIAVTSEKDVPEKYRWAFDRIIEIPWGDNAENSEWKLENEWKLFHITPYKETIKLDCDMLFFSDITSWWRLFEKRDVVCPTRVLNCQNQLVENTYYRPGFKENGVPTLHTAFTYFKHCDLALEWFEMAEIITHNWEKFYWEYMPVESPKILSTDTTFSLAAKLIDRVEDIVSPWEDIPSFVHAKTQLNTWGKYYTNENWNENVPFYFTPEIECFIGPYRITKPLHYHLKHLITDDIVKQYEKAILDT